MISRLVNPVSGYITLSRLDSSSSRPAMWTRTRSFIDRLLGCLVRPQADIPGEAKPAIAGQLPVPHLHDEARLGEDGLAGVLAWQRLRERRHADLQLLQSGEQVLFGRRR